MRVKYETLPCDEHTWERLLQLMCKAFIIIRLATANILILISGYQCTLNLSEASLHVWFFGQYYCLRCCIKKSSPWIKQTVRCQ